MEKNIKSIDYTPPLTLAKIASFLAVACLFINYFFFLILNNTPAAPRMLITEVGLFSFCGVFIGALLCRFFLPSPGAGSVISKKPLFLSLIFIGLIIIPNVILRALGTDAFFGVLPVRAFASIFSGMLYPVCFGLFFLTHKHSAKKVIIFSVSMSVGYLAMFLFNPVLGSKEASVTLNTIKWIIAGIGVFASLSCFFFSKVTITTHNPTKNKTKLPVLAQTHNWSMIFRLIGLASVLKILHATTDIHLLPGLRYSAVIFHPYFLIVGLSLPIFSFFAGRSIEKFIKLMIPPAICLLILLPCLPLFEDYTVFIFIINVLLGFLHYLIWIVFTAALVEYYKGGIWYYSMVSVVYFTYIFSFSGIIGRHIPDGIEFSVLLSSISAIAFFALSFRILFPKTAAQNTLQNAALSASPIFKDQSIEDIFIAHGLSGREIDVAHLLLKPGCLEAKEIGELMFIAPTTVKSHITNIYRKFNVNKRSEFMAIFIWINNEGSFP